MALFFDKPLAISRPYKSYRFDGFSLKADRRVTLYGKPALCQLIELEANAEVTALCERPLIIPDTSPKRVVDFWAMEGGVSILYLLGSASEFSERSKKRQAYVDFADWAKQERAQVKEVSVDTFESRRVRLENWLAILQHVVNHRGFLTDALLERCAAEFPKRFTLTQIESTMNDLDAMLVRAAVFHLLLRGSLRCPDIDEQHLHPHTAMERL
jgi:hypothetical protein